eukprot:JZ554007.1.p2 GENE.JZ554007.1~~JZ554007.1.p2  ORF type:complete len:92 (-),score=4.35 JZ554007.1:198-473(-)
MSAGVAGICGLPALNHRVLVSQDLNMYDCSESFHDSGAEISNSALPRGLAEAIMNSSLLNFVLAHSSAAGTDVSANVHHIDALVMVSHNHM